MTARLAIKLIQEEELIKDYIEKGYTNKLIKDELNKELRFVNFVVDYILSKKKNTNSLEEIMNTYAVTDGSGKRFDEYKNRLTKT